jgi:hypothetical protein
MPYLLLLFEERLLLLLPLALARSLCARLFWVLALPPLLAAWARLDLPEDDDLEEEEEEELRDAIACSLGRLNDRPSSLLRPRCQSRQTFRASCRFAQPLRVGIALPAGDSPDDDAGPGTAAIARLPNSPLPYKCGTVRRPP